MLKNIFLLFIVLVLGGCVMDRKSGIIVIANDTNSAKLVAKQPIQDITDSLVFSNLLDKDELSSGEIRSIWLPYSNLRNLPSSEKVYFYIFNVDSLEKYRKAKKVDGIIDLCLIKKFSIQLNKVEDQLDTVYVNEQ